MKKHIWVLAAFGFCTAVNFASAEDIYSCRSFAEAAADEWADGRISPAGATDSAGSNQLLVISYGKKYIVPRKIPNDGSVITQGLGRLAAQRNQVYEEELVRCQRPREFKIKVYIK